MLFCQLDLLRKRERNIVFTKYMIQIRKMDREEWLKDINNEARFRKFSRQRKEAHNIIKCEKRKYIYRGCRTRV